MITIEMIRGNVEFLEKMKHNYELRLEKLPEGTLFYRIQHGKARPFRRLGRREKYLSRDKAELIEGLSNRMEIQRSLEIVETNLVLLRDLLEAYQEPELMIPSCLALSKLTGKAEVKSRTAVVDAIQKWYGIRTGNPKYDPGTKIASDGTLLKSRADLIGYEFLKMRGVNFKYEHPVMINGELWYPDFMIIRKSDNKVFIWEHFGMMDREKYHETTGRKLRGYAAEGFLPFENLIITYDFGDDRIDLVWVTKLLELFGIL